MWSKLHDGQVSEVFGDVFQLIQEVVLIVVSISSVDDAMLYVIVNQRLLGCGDRTLNGVQLLYHFNARCSRLHHGHDVLQMPTRSLEPVNNLGVTIMRM
jgi:hypothetical protein